MIFAPGTLVNVQKKKVSGDADSFGFNVSIGPELKGNPALFLSIIHSIIQVYLGSHGALPESGEGDSVIHRVC